MRDGQTIRYASEMDRRIVVIETQMLNMASKLDQHIIATNALVARLDERQDKADIQQARLIGGLVVAQFLAIMFAPALRAALGLST